MKENLKDAMIGGGLIALGFVTIWGLLGAIVGFIVGTLVSWCVITLFRKAVPRKTLEEKAIRLLKEEIMYNRNKYPLEIADKIWWTGTEVSVLDDELRYNFSCGKSIDQEEIKEIMKLQFNKPNLILQYCYYSKLPWVVACYDENENFLLKVTLSHDEIDAVIPPKYKIIES